MIKKNVNKQLIYTKLMMVRFITIDLNLTSVNIVNDFQKVLPCACAIKIPIASGRVNIRICRDITGEMWFGVISYEVKV